MAYRYPVTWLMTDERLGDALWQALRALPPGSGVVFRHYATPRRARHALLRRLWRLTRARRLVLVVARGPAIGEGRHAAPCPAGLTTWPAHDDREAIIASRAGADMLFVSPVHPTRSHPGEGALGAGRAARIGARLDLPRIALGGMDARRSRRLRGFHGWAAIDAWRPRPDQKRKAVPR